MSHSMEGENELQSAQQVELDAETDPQPSNPDKADSNAIRHRTEACKHLFESCQTLCNDERVDRLCAKFHWWSLGIGASKHGHSSLDYRVRTREDIRDKIVNLLDMLAISLQSCIGITAANRKEQITITAGSDTESDHGHSHLEETMNYIRSNIEYLLRISAAIRKSGTKFRHKHVDEFLGDGKVDLREFGDYLRNLILFVPTQLAFGNAHQAYLENPRRLGPIQERLIQANLVRRNRFEHYYKMSLKEDVSPLMAEDINDQASAAPQKMQKSDGTSLVDRSVISSRTATEIGTFVMPEKPRSHQTKSSSSRVSRSVLKQDYPRCPVTGKDFWCPFCAQPLDSSYSDPKKNMKWRGHVSEDLSPYTCIYPDCDQPDAMYVTTDEWRKHLKVCHSISRWICDICWLESSSPGDFEFDEEEKWREHSLSCHSGEISVQDLDDIAEESKRAVVPSVACPLCYDSTVLLQPDAHKHIANHLHSFALQALPWTATVPDDDTRASDGSNTGRPHLDGEDDLEEIDWSAPYNLQDLAPLLDDSISRCQHLSRSMDSKKLRDTWNRVVETLHNLKQALSSLSIAQVGEVADPMIRLNTILSRPDDSQFITSDMPTLEMFGVDLEEALGSLQAIVTKSFMKAVMEAEPPGAIPASSERQPDLQSSQHNMGLGQNTDTASYSDESAAVIFSDDKFEAPYFPNLKYPNILDIPHSNSGEPWLQSDQTGDPPDFPGVYNRPWPDYERDVGNSSASTLMDPNLPLNYHRQPEIDYLDPTLNYHRQPEIDYPSFLFRADDSTNLSYYPPEAPSRSRPASAGSFEGSREGPFQCNSCDKRFSTRKDLDRHKATRNHRPEGQRVNGMYHCRCGMRTHRKDNYKRHQKSCVPEKYRHDTFFCKCSVETSDKTNHLAHIEECRHGTNPRGRPARQYISSAPARFGD